MQVERQRRVATPWDGHRLTDLLGIGVAEPFSHAFQSPELAGWSSESSITPELAVHGAADPDSNPGLPLSGVVQVGSPVWAGTLTASQAAFTLVQRRRARPPPRGGRPGAVSA